MKETQPASLTIEPIGTTHSPFKQKFGIPRQPGLAKHSLGYIEMHPKYSRPEAFDGIEQFSHLWIEFFFHETASKDWKASVRPPRLGGNKKLGCFATRTNFRPNNIGLSVVKFEKIDISNGKIKLYISGHDLLDQTPIIDIKPYIPYSDIITDASAGLFEEAPSSKLTIEFTDNANLQLQQAATHYPKLKKLIKEVLEQDPRPAYMKEKPNREGFTIRLYNIDIKWTFNDGSITVIELIELN